MAVIYNCFNKDSPLPSDSDWDDNACSLAVKRIMVMLDYLKEQWGEIWSGYRKIHFSWAYVNKKQKLVMHFGKCLCRDTSLIPNGDQLEQLKETLAKDGLKEEPGCHFNCNLDLDPLFVIGCHIYLAYFIIFTMSTGFLQYLGYALNHLVKSIVGFNQNAINANIASTTSAFVVTLVSSQMVTNWSN
ncbi:uncharacterized protein LACBIDRAFT_334655 [Laccaria bicolor S238N-H82]|uniref:Predicted protein n=1 Tax=Laccaria bicolor (strain S238N-H82 / ATCC MYA-4686) TaxID=486041 RepID=B0DZV0_LACBS|nr:uncharacterized protein LACBIDRAFT_334655 [Laccaria bicolor S238N-H82]EDQ99900.1 predicted protein [Laccaria bicolor S238N-H82]|eukprot:XP_001889443.1 predicted protein [Laccaria bicolor S238N-H82]